MKTFLHVGCGVNRKQQSTLAFAGPDWSEVRLDIDPAAEPDIVGSMGDLGSLTADSFDAIYSSHNIEHLYPHEVVPVLRGFLRVLKVDGFFVVTCPDLRSVARLVADDRLTEPAYLSPAGPIAPIDILYGHRPHLAAGNLYMAHRCGFTLKVLTGTLRDAGFNAVASMARESPFFDLWAVASKSARSETAMRELAAAHFPAERAMAARAGSKVA